MLFPPFDAVLLPQPGDMRIFLQGDLHTFRSCAPDTRYVQISLNKDFLNTIKYLEGLGVRYFSCSGLIPTGNAKTSESQITALTKSQILDIVREASSYARAHNLEVAFTSPGWIDGEYLKKMRMVVPSCGACLSNMAIAPNGMVIPCQSWLFEDGFGNILDVEWKKIWNHKDCKKRRKF